MLLSHHQNAGQNHDMLIAENVAHCTYHFGMTVTNQNFIDKKFEEETEFG
jgi:hypothetical protein